MPMSSPLEQNYVEGSKSISQFKEYIYEQNSSQWNQFQYEADLDMRIYTGDSEALHSYAANTYNYKKSISHFNKVMPIVNMVSGNQIKNRKTSVLVPQEPQDQNGSDQASNLLLWSMQRANSFPHISTAFRNSLITGMCLIGVYLDYTDDPINGTIKEYIVNYDSFLIDPFFKRMDLSDCRYLWCRKWLSKDKVKMLLPKREKEIDAFSMDYNKDGKFPFMPENMNFNNNSALLVYDEIWYADTKRQEMLLDTRTGETHKWQGDDETLEMFMMQYPEVKKITQTIPTVKYAVTVNDRTMVDGDHPFGLDKYSHVPMACYFHPEIAYFPQRIFGMVRGLRDPQWSYARRMRLNLNYLEAGVARGLKYKENALVDPDDVFLEGMGRGIAIKASASLDDVQEMPPPQIPPSWFQEIEKLDTDMMRIAGVSEVLMGIDDDDRAGILNILKQQAGLTTLSPIFENLDQTQKLLSQLHLDYIQNWEVGKLERILNEQVDPMIKSKYFSKFDIQIIDGAMTPTQQVMEFKQLMEMIQAQILPVTPEIFEILMKTAPLQNKKDLIEAVKKQQEAQAKQAEQQQQLAMEELKAKANLANARAYADQGLGAERISRIPENKALAAERVEEARKDRELADLHKARAIKELTDIDLSQIEKAIGLLQMIQGIQAQEQTTTESISVGNDEVSEKDVSVKENI